MLFLPKTLQMLHTWPSIFQQVAHLRGDTLWGFNADGGVPLSWWQNSHLVQELIYPSQQVTPVFRLVSHVMEDLVRETCRFSVCARNPATRSIEAQVFLLHQS